MRSIDQGKGIFPANQTPLTGILGGRHQLLHRVCSFFLLTLGHPRHSDSKCPILIARAYSVRINVFVGHHCFTGQSSQSGLVLHRKRWLNLTHARGWLPRGIGQLVFEPCLLSSIPISRACWLQQLSNCRVANVGSVRHQISGISGPGSRQAR